VVKRTGDGLIVEFRSVVDAVRYAPSKCKRRWSIATADRRIDFRVGIHLRDIVEESDGAI